MRALSTAHPILPGNSRGTTNGHQTSPSRQSQVSAPVRCRSAPPGTTRTNVLSSSSSVRAGPPGPSAKVGPCQGNQPRRSSRRTPDREVRGRPIVRPRSDRRSTPSGFEAPGQSTVASTLGDRDAAHRAGPRHDGDFPGRPQRSREPPHPARPRRPGLPALSRVSSATRVWPRCPGLPALPRLPRPPGWPRRRASSPGRPRRPESAPPRVCAAPSPRRPESALSPRPGRLRGRAVVAALVARPVVSRAGVGPVASRGSRRWSRPRAAGRRAPTRRRLVRPTSRPGRPSGPTRPGRGRQRSGLPGRR
jgi:hypothetical protein